MHHRLTSGEGIAHRSTEQAPEAANAVVRFYDWLVPPATYGTPNLRRRAQVLATVGLILCSVGCLRFGIFLRAGNHALAGMFAVVAASGLLYAATPRRGWNLAWVGNLFTAEVLGVVCLVSVFRGGIGSSTLGILAVIPLCATFVVGWRSGVLWWLGCVCGVIGLAVAQGSGLVVLTDRLGQSAHFTDAATAVIVPTCAQVLALAFEWTRAESGKAMEEAIRQQSDAEKLVILAKADKMASVGLLAAGVGHEINNPLTYVKANVEFAIDEVMQSKEIDREQLLEALRDASDGVRRIAKITSDLGTFARSDNAAEIEVVHLGAVAHTAADLTRHELEKRATLNMDLAEVTSVLAVESRLVQVVVNLLINAAHAVEGQPQSAITIRTGTRGAWTWLEVSDTGPGIPEDRQEQIFDPFFTTKPVGSGTGLGLSTSRALAQAMGGTLRLTSTSGQGATFRLALPTATRRQNPAAPDLKPPSGHIRRLLVVSDEERSEKALRRILIPHDVVWCGSGEAALECLQSDTEFDLILCDVMMHPMPGWELLQCIQAQHPTLSSRFVFMTGGELTPAARQRVRESIAPVLEESFDLAQVLTLAQTLGPVSTAMGPQNAVVEHYSITR